MKVMGGVLLLSAAVMLGACATVPTGPTVMVMPGQGKTFEAFQADDAACRQWAAQQAGASPGQTATSTAAAGAIAGTLLGAGLGAGIGAATGSVGTGAAVGGAAGLVGGSAIGSEQGQEAGSLLQRRYDNAYSQCMYAKGNQVPVMAPMQSYPTVAPPPPQ